MRWIPISKAKVNFKTLYLIASPDLERPCVGTLKESKITPEGVKHSFLLDVETEEALDVNVTHVSIITNP